MFIMILKKMKSVSDSVVQKFKCIEMKKEINGKHKTVLVFLILSTRRVGEGSQTRV